MGKRKGNDSWLKAAAGTVIALVVSVAIFLIANALAPFRHLGPRAEAAEGMRQIFMFHTGISSLMLVFSLYLFFIYLRDYLQLKSRFTLGLLLAIFSFILFAVAANPILLALFGVYGQGGIFSIVPYAFATISLAILAWLSSK